MNIASHILKQLFLFYSVTHILYLELIKVGTPTKKEVVQFARQIRSPRIEEVRVCFTCGGHFDSNHIKDLTIILHILIVFEINR